MIQSEIEKDFELALRLVTDGPINKNATPISLSNEKKLQFYGYYKCATMGPCNIKAPSMFSIVARAKWDAWNKSGSISKQEAMRLYIALIEDIDINWKKTAGFEEETIKSSIVQKQEVEVNTGDNSDSDNEEFHEAITGESDAAEDEIINSDPNVNTHSLLLNDISEENSQQVSTLQTDNQVNQLSTQLKQESELNELRYTNLMKKLEGITHLFSLKGGTIKVFQPLFPFISKHPLAQYAIIFLFIVLPLFAHNITKSKIPGNIVSIVLLGLLSFSGFYVLKK